MSWVRGQQGLIYSYFTPCPDQQSGPILRCNLCEKNVFKTLATEHLKECYSDFDNLGIETEILMKSTQK